MADAKQYTSVTGFNPDGAPGGSAGSEPASKIISEDIRDLKHDLWAAFWGPGPDCPNFNSGTEADRRIGWNQDPNGRHSDTFYQSSTSISKSKLGGISGHPAATNSTNGAVATSSVSVTTPTDTTDNSGDETPIDFVPTGQAGYNYPTTTGPAYWQIHAILGRVNDSILRTGHGSSSNNTMPLLSTSGSYTKYDGTAASALTEDTGRVSKRHLDRISEEIEYLRADYERANKLNKGDATWHSETPQSGSATTVGQWGSDEWGGNQWENPTGTDTGIQRPFSEMRILFDDFNELRYFFNQGGQIIWEGGDSNGSRSGDSTWNSIHDHRCYFGANNPEYRTGSGNTGANSTQTNVSWVSANTGSYTVTDYCPRIHGIGDKANANITGTGASSTDGIVITGLSSTTGISAGDIFRVQNNQVNSTYPFAGEVKSVDNSSQITLRRKLRMGYTGAEPSSSISNLDWSVCKYYRIGYLKGAGSLYGGGGDAGSVGDPAPDDGYIYFDWAISAEPGLTNKIAVLLRVMCDNTVNHMRMGDMNVHHYGPSQPQSSREFEAESAGVFSFDWATAEDEWNGSSNDRYQYRERFTTDPDA